jgi:hypothetical protein
MKKEIDQYTSLFKESFDVFAWTYNDLKAYYRSLFQHVSHH